MKKSYISALILSSLFFVGCATTGQVANNVADGESDQENIKIENTTDSGKTSATETSKTTDQKTVQETSKTSQTATTDKTVQAEISVLGNPDEDPETVFVEKELVLDGAYEVKSSLDAACKTAKFQMEAPSTFAIYKTSSYRAIAESRIDVIYKNTKKSDEEICVRKAVGNLDASIDSNDYPVEKFLNYGGIKILVRGKADEEYRVATWTSGDYSYAVESNVGFPKDVIFALIQEIN